MPIGISLAPDQIKHIDKIERFIRNRFTEGVDNLLARYLKEYESSIKKGSGSKVPTGILNWDKEN